MTPEEPMSVSVSVLDALTPETVVSASVSDVRDTTVPWQSHRCRCQCHGQVYSVGNQHIQIHTCYVRGTSSIDPLLKIPCVGILLVLASMINFKLFPFVDVKIKF